MIICVRSITPYPTLSLNVYQLSFIFFVRKRKTYLIRFEKHCIEAIYLQNKKIFKKKKLDIH